MAGSRQSDLEGMVALVTGGASGILLTAKANRRSF